jgi:cellulose 1,4-beta-cellobiosidase
MNMSNAKRFSIIIAVLAITIVAAFGMMRINARAATICSPATAITVPFTKDGAGDFCYVTSDLCNYVNNWNMTALEINGTAYTNIYVASSSVARVNGVYTIHYVGPYAWSHLEIGAPCGGGTPPPATTAAPVFTATRTNTPGGPTPTKTNTPFVLTPTKTGSAPAFTATKTKTLTVVPPTVTKTPTGPVLTPTKTLTPPPQGSHLSNPFSGATFYVNQFWQGHSTFNVNTSVWLDSIAAVNGTNGYPLSASGHMDAALAQGKNAISIVVYDLPGRDCSALASNGELPATEAGLTTYETQYIDPIAAAIAAHPNLRVIAIIEPDSLPNMITNLGVSACANVNSQTLYQRGTAYTLTKLHALSNAYTYIDIGHAGWLGWPNNFNPAITLISNVIKSANGGNCGTCADGFADGTANTQVETETFLDANTMVGGQPVRSQTFFSYNDYIDESHYATAWKTAMQAAGIANTNVVLDTSRNGWGGCGGGSQALTTCRPTATSTSTDLTTYVNQSRIDRRPAKGDWCNQNGAGLGKLPGVGTTPYVYYLWIKPPAESDGSSSLIPVGPDNPNGKGFDQMCDPSYGGNSLNQNMNSNALPNAPVSGNWFAAQWTQLVANKFP